MIYVIKVRYGQGGRKLIIQLKVSELAGFNYLQRMSAVHGPVLLKITKRARLMGKSAVMILCKVSDQELMPNETKLVHA